MPSFARRAAALGGRDRAPRFRIEKEAQPSCLLSRQTKREGGRGVLVEGTHLATRRPATEQSEGAQLGAPPEPNAADEEDPPPPYRQGSQSARLEASALLSPFRPVRARCLSRRANLSRPFRARSARRRG